MGCLQPPNKSNTGQPVDAILRGGGFENEAALMRQVRQYLEISEQHFKFGTIYNRKIQSTQDLVDDVKMIMHEQTGSFTLQVQIGYILKNLRTGRFRLFFAS